LALGLGLAGFFGKTLSLSLAGCLRCFGGLSSGDLSQLLRLSLSFFLLAALLGSQCRFYAESCFFASLSARSRKIPIFSPMQVCPGIEGCHIILSRPVFLVSERIWISHS
jgi:hypothetical protein